ncbi:hypothetical protein SOCE26_021310 [Sorangium cellulosum]|uniref:Secreted protein n=1 Tax=Sorangium cellulosum TaxID=56 RepID=A0A2L0EN73_SORCE|nr:hypothetical protein [Sorangium cellulosum]AUX40730.1 hypothetical protein SOCE26_021310 [Sorangium cellulosum]
MHNSDRIAVSFLGLLGMCLMACVGEADAPGEEQADAVEQGFLTRNALTPSALTANRSATQALTEGPLTSAAIAGNEEVMSALRDPLARDFLSYAVGCALPAEQSVEFSLDGEVYVVEGDIGVAPEWGRAHGHCNARCQGWISACILARINHLGERVPISMRGKNKALESDAAERAAFPLREATYFGDLFAPEPRRYACKSPGSTLISRVCGGTGVDTDGCIVDVLGDCDDVCHDPASDGSFPNCAADGRTISTTVTVFRQ